MSKGLKRSEVIKKIKNIGKKWENSKIDTKFANEILQTLENMGIICPPERVVAKAKSIGKKGTVPVYGMEWEPEHKTKIPVKYFVEK